jgi:salicylate hydroxylase
MPGLIVSEEPATYNVAIIGSGLGGLSAAVALRRQGHNVTIYERYDFGGEVGASLSVASNGSRLLQEWEVDIKAAKPVVLRSLIMHDWSTGEVKSTYDLGDYKSKFGTDYNNFHRIDLHNLLKQTAVEEAGKGRPCKLEVWHKAVQIDPEAGRITFENGTTATADLVIAADGIRSLSRQQIGVEPKFVQSTSCCYRCIISADKLRELGLEEYLDNDAIEFWGGYGINKIVLSACSDNNVVSCYCFYPAELNDARGEDGWNISTTPQNLVQTFPGLDARLHKLFLNAEDIKMWRLYNHDPYPYWAKGKVALLGDAAHPMVPDQSQGACMAIEDAGALGIVFSPKYSHLDVPKKLQLYEMARKDRATRVQSASARARTDLSERIGWSTSTDRPGKLTIEEICGYNMHEHIEQLASSL